MWGVSLADIQRQSDYNGLNIKIYGGMSAGLPLATPSQSGLLVSGSVYQAYGNWIGTEQSIVFLILPPVGASDTPLNVPFTWTKGQSLAAAIRATLQVAVPTLTPSINISPNLVLGYTETGYYTNLQQFAQWINQRSQAIIGGAYQGVQISTKGNTIQVWDGTQAQSGTIQIQPWDLIGQPTWQDQANIVFQTRHASRHRLAKRHTATANDHPTDIEFTASFTGSNHLHWPLRRAGRPALWELSSTIG